MISIPELASRYEQREYKKDREKGLKIFLEARLLNHRFMAGHTLDEVKEMARLFDKKGSDFESIWNDTLSLVNKVKSKMIEYGKEWSRILLLSAYRHTCTSLRPVVHSEISWDLQDDT
jgi:hypothetical protein